MKFNSQNMILQRLGATPASGSDPVAAAGATSRSGRAALGRVDGNKAMAPSASKKYVDPVKALAESLQQERIWAEENAALVGLFNDMCIELLGGDATEAVVEPGLGAKERAASTAKTAIGKLQELKMTLRRQSFDAKEQQFEVEHLRSQALLLRATTA